MIDLLYGAARSLWRKGRRTLLTALSIAIGVCSVIAISSLGRSGISLINREIGQLGLEGMVLTADSKLTEYRLDEESCVALAGLESVEHAAGMAIETGKLRMHGLISNTVVWGVGRGYRAVMSLPLVYGRYLEAADLAEGAAVCLLDEQSAREFYHRGNIVGKTLSLECGGRRAELEIVGIVEAAGGSGLQSLLGEYIPSFLYLPAATLQSLTGKAGFSQISLRAAEGADDEILRSAERSSGVAGAFVLDDLSAQNRRLNGLLENISFTLSLIAAVSLVVAAVGTMAIMTASVRERTREIGIKKSIGATSRRIMAEFLAESVMVCCLGAAWGTGLAVALVWAVGRFAPGLPVAVSGVGLSAALCVALGAVFGMLPAAQAARLDPVEALRDQV